MQFSRLEIRHTRPAAIKPLYDLDGRRICQCCGDEPVLGYIGNGTLVNNLGAKCYRRRSNDRSASKGPRFYCLEGRS